jgi:hypothetical protein
MSILSRLSALFQKNETVKEAGTDFIRALAQEAIANNDPAALAEVATLWDTLRSGEESLLTSGPPPKAVLPSETSATYTGPDEMQEHVLAIMRDFWINGKFQATNGDIRKALDNRMVQNGGWKDGDLEDWDETRPGIQHRWRRTLTECLKMMRSRGIIENDKDAWKTYRLCKSYWPKSDRQLPSVEANQNQLRYFEQEPDWESV